MVSEEEFVPWAAQGLHLLELTFGKQSIYYEEFKQTYEQSKTSFTAFQACVNLLNKARKDFSEGWLVSVRQLASAEVFEDLLEMASHLHSEGYHLAAIAVTGAVLEDNLRKLCVKNEVRWEGHSSIGKVNKALYRKGVYEQSEWHHVQGWSDLRNRADHGKVSNSERQSVSDEKGEPLPIADPAEVKGMVSGVRAFVAKYLG